MKKKKEENMRKKKHLKKGFLGEKGQNPLNLQGKWPFWVCGLSYFSFDSGCFCLTSVLIISVFLLFFFCLPSVLILSVLLLSWFFLSYFCLAQNRWAPIKQEKVVSQKRHPQNGLGSAVPVSQPKNFEPNQPHRFCRTVLQNRWPRSPSAQIRRANLRTYMLGQNAPFWHMNAAKLAQPPRRAEENLDQKMPENQGFQN